MNATYTANVASDLFNAGRTEDGTPYIAEIFYALIENQAGRRFRHNATFSAVEVIVDEYEGGTYFANRREQAAAKAERLTVRVNAALKAGEALDTGCWEEVDPAYGSDEYISQGTEAKRAYADRFDA
jgi:hypothetical protein